MDDLERLVRGLVDVLTAGDSTQLRSPFQISELYQSILPYRQHKRRLGFDTNQDYEMALLRLLSGERGYASIEPPEVQQQLLAEAESVNPNPGAFREFAAARVILNEDTIRANRRSSDAYAPPPPASQPTPRSEAKSDRVSRYAPPPPAPPPPRATPVFEAVEQPSDTSRPPKPAPETTSRTTCPQCEQRLPEGRRVLFCPFCGRRIAISTCSNCGNHIEPGWRFCATCGEPGNRG